MADWVRALAVLAEDPGLVPSIHMATQLSVNSISRGSMSPLLASSEARHTCDAHTYMQAKY